MSEPEKLTLRLELAREGGYVAEVEELPGCVTEGDTLAETLANLSDAITGVLEVR